MMSGRGGAATPEVPGSPSPSQHDAMNDQSNGPPNGGSTDRNPNQPTPDQLYLAERLDETLTPAAIVKLNKAHGRIAVLEAMRQLHGSPPAVPVEDVYGWLGVVASFKEAGR